MRFTFQIIQKVRQEKVPSYVSNESSSEILVLCHWVEMKTPAKIDNLDPFFWARNFLKQGDRLKLWDLNLDSDFI